MTNQREVKLLDLSSEHDTFRDDVCRGLARERSSLSCIYLYDEFGSRLFDLITDLDEYYPTRTEIGILRENGDRIAAAVGPECMIVEPGSGAGTKTRILLERIWEPAAYVPVDVSREMLLQSSRELAGLFPDIEVLPVCADFNQVMELPRPRRAVRRRILFFPGSTIGNLEPDRAEDLLRRFLRICGPGGGLLLGVDLKKDERSLTAAYNDALGVTAAFNLNLLRRINRELDANFDLAQFRHRAVYNRRRGRVEMHLQSIRPQEVRVGDRRFSFRMGETIHTENSYKYTLEEFAARAKGAGARIRHVWTDKDRRFSVQFLVTA